MINILSKKVMAKTQKQIIGAIGEGLSKDFLKNNGFVIVDRNYRRKWGEIDIVTKKNGAIHFIEVKTVIRETSVGNVSYENSDFEPIDNVNYGKRQRLSRIIETYILDKRLEDVDWQIDVISVYLNKENRLLNIDFLEDIELV